jgi:ubiquinone/menaquinone biosynthesis C-methylase UbiE
MSFDVLAPHYRWMEFVLAGDKLQRCRTAFLDRVTDARDVLIVGEGHGRFLVECRRRLPKAQITCVDASKNMLNVAGAQLERTGAGTQNVAFVHADILKWDPGNTKYDLLVTHFFLDCFRSDQLEKVIEGLARAAHPRASWLLADFQAPASGLSALRARLILKTMYLFFRAIARLPAKSLTSPDPFIQAAGFKLRQRNVSEWGLLRADFWMRNW